MKLRNHTSRDSEQKAYPVRAFGKLFGKQPCWVRRQINQGKIKAIKGFGEWLIPASEIDVILDSIADSEGGLI